MKNILISTFLFTLLFFFGCQGADNSKRNLEEDTKVSSNEKEVAIKEISNIIEGIVRSVSHLDVDGVLKPYSNDANFRMVNPDASVSDFQTLKSNQTKAFERLTSASVKTVKQDFTFLSNNLVICTWTGSTEFELKTGGRGKIESYVDTMLFERKNNEWKIIYVHESSTPPIEIK